MPKLRIGIRAKAYSTATLSRFHGIVGNQGSGVGLRQTVRRGAHVRKTLFYLLLLSVALFCPTAESKSTGSHHSSTSSHREASSSKTVHVRGYTKKNGTYVAPHDRQRARRCCHFKEWLGESSSHPYRSGRVAAGYTAHPSIRRSSTGKIKRSAAAKNAFNARAHVRPTATRWVRAQATLLITSGHSNAAEPTIRRTCSGRQLPMARRRTRRNGTVVNGLRVLSMPSL